MRKNPFGRKDRLNGTQAELLRQNRPAGVSVKSGIIIRGQLTRDQRRAISNMSIGYRGGTHVDLTGRPKDKDRLALFLKEQKVDFIEGEIQ